MTPWFRNAEIVALVLCLLSPSQAAAQQASAPPASGRSRVAWTLIGAGIGFGGGLVLGLRAFDDAVYAERKIVTTAIVGAAAGGLTGALLSRRSASRAADMSRPDATSDPLWNGMWIGAAAGAGVGLWYVPKANCKTDINPECPGVLRAAVGIPAVAGGAALGALVDRLVQPRPAPAPAASKPATSIGPVIGRRTVGVQFTRTF